MRHPLYAFVVATIATITATAQGPAQTAQPGSVRTGSGGW